MIPSIKISDYFYPLPDERIAKYPLEQRDSSKLLIYSKGEVSESVFRNLPQFIDNDSLMIFNDTKVVPARLFFQRETGAHIEIFCLEPSDPSDYNLSFASTESCRWKCVIGNSKKWKGDILRFCSDDDSMNSLDLRARLVGLEGKVGIVEFFWKGEASFSQVLEQCGKVPIPPYLNRETETIDLERYQTLYAHIRGSVAAPTAGLHFTDGVLEEIKNRGVRMQNICLHVGAGTFLPVKTDDVSEHCMHREIFSVKKSILEAILEVNKNVNNCNKRVVAVGTTSVRTLESLYYLGVSILELGEPKTVEQWAPYTRDYSYSTAESLAAILDWMNKNKKEEITAGTRIIIVPGFRFRVVDRMVTNFHQPGSTLILLIAAFVGGDWRKIYDYALGHNFRFLSYGDSSFLIRR